MPISREKAKRLYLIERKDALEVRIIELLLKHPQKMFTSEEVFKRSNFEKNYIQLYSDLDVIPMSFERILRELIQEGIVEEVVISKDRGISYFGLVEKWR